MKLYGFSVHDTYLEVYGQGLVLTFALLAVILTPVAIPIIGEPYYKIIAKPLGLPKRIFPKI